MGKIVTLLLIIWLLVGALASYQRGDFSDAETNCAEAGSIALTVVAGPLNYVGVNPEVDCEDVDVPEPSE